MKQHGNQTTTPSSKPALRGGPRGGGGHGGHFQKPKDTRTTLTRLLGYLKKDIPLLILVIVMILVSTGTQLTGTLLLTPIINTATGALPGGLTKIAQYLLLLIVVYILGIAITFVQNRLMIRISQSTVLKMRNELYDKLMKLSLRVFDTTPHGDLMSRFTNDMDTISESMNTSVTQLAASLFSLVGTLISMIIISPLLTLVTLLLLPMMIGIASTIIKKSRNRFRSQQESLGKLNGFMEEMIEGQREVKVFNREEKTQESFTEYNEQYRRHATMAQIFSGIMMPLMQHIGTFNYVFVATLGGLLAIRGTLSVGAIATFLNLARQFSRPVTEISNQLGMIQSALAGAERVFEIMDMQPEPPDDEKAVSLVYENGTYFWQTAEGRQPVHGEVRFEDVVFGYSEGKPVLQGISLLAKPGQKIALVGSTGAGKTTITNLLTRFYDIQSGRITIDGIELRDIKLYDLRQCLAMVLQDTHLFTGTVMENIRYGRLDATDEECVDAAKLASAHSFIRRLADEYETLLEGDGANLSQGQRQLLNIARAAVANPPILILDEATSSVDTRTEMHIERGMDRLMEGRTTFVIAHRLSTVRNASAILVIEQGQILEYGSHDELIAKQGRYYQLYTGQTELD